MADFKTTVSLIRLSVPGIRLQKISFKLQASSGVKYDWTNFAISKVSMLVIYMNSKYKSFSYFYYSYYY